MALQTLRPNAAGDKSQFSCSGTPHEAVSDQSDTTYIYKGGSSNLTHLFNIPSMNAASAIAKITVYARAKQTDLSDGIYIEIKDSLGHTNSSARMNISDSWVTKSKEWATNPETTSAWTDEEINGLQIGVTGASVLYGASGYIQVSEIYIVVDYTPVSAPTVSNDGEANLAATSVTLRGSITDTGGQNATSLKFIYKVGSAGAEVEIILTGDGSAQQYTYNLTGLE
jgi:hypothetical protein